MGWGLPYYCTQSETSSVCACFRKLTILRGVTVYAELPCIWVIVAVLYFECLTRIFKRKKKKTCVEIIAHGVTPSG